MSKVSNSGSTGLVISEDYIPVDAYQAIYHKLTKKTESISKRYAEQYTITFDDIVNLNQRIEQGLRHIKDIRASNCEITHSTYNDYSNTYSSFDRFRIANLEVRELTSVFVYEFNFLVVLENDIKEAKNIGQRYKLVLFFDQNIPDNEDVYTPYYMRNAIKSGFIYMTIEYTDFAIAQNIDAIINTWRKALPEKKISPLLKSVLLLEGQILHSVPTISAMLPLLGTAWFIGTGNKFGERELAMMAFAIAVSYGVRTVTSMSIEYMFSTLKRIISGPMVLLTKGDKDRAEEINRNSKNTRGKLAFVFVELIVAFAVGIFSSWFYDLVVPS